jgi:ubiquinone/menaquinone biosynthesis C-methylase UbiE
VQSNLEKRWQDKFDLDRPGKAYRICSLLSSMSKHSDPIILDIGSNDGHMDQYYSEYTKKLVIGIDISYSAVKAGSMRLREKNITNIEFIIADAKALPIRDQKVDWIICAQMIDALDNKETLIREFERTLKNEGLVYLSVLNRFILGLYLRFPRLLVPHLGLFYGRVYPSLKAPYVTPMHYDYWKKDVVATSELEVRDASTDLIFQDVKGDAIQEESSKEKIRRAIIRFIYFRLARISPSWAFILRRKS